MQREEDARSAGDALHCRLRDDEAAFAAAARVRLHRAISWLRRAERESGDHDACFLFLWIAFNAAYAREVGPHGSAGEGERGRFGEFFDGIVGLDSKRALHGLLFRQFTGSLRTLIDNRHVFEPFWKALRTHDASGQWEERFAASKRAAMHAIVTGQTALVLSIVFDRLYVLRNQLVHGGATWNGSVNRSQVLDGARILHALVPAIVEVMLDNPEADFGEVMYPVVG